MTYQNVDVSISHSQCNTEFEHQQDILSKRQANIFENRLIHIVNSTILFICVAKFCGK
jgi:hypothetical protein